MNAATIEFPEELVERIAGRAAEIVLEKQGGYAEAAGWLRGAEEIAAYLGCSTSRIYALNSARRLPVIKDGASIIARRSALDAWVEEGGARCP